MCSSLGTAFSRGLCFTQPMWIHNSSSYIRNDTSAGLIQQQAKGWMGWPWSCTAVTLLNPIHAMPPLPSPSKKMNILTWMFKLDCIYLIYQFLLHPACLQIFTVLCSVLSWLQKNQNKFAIQIQKNTMIEKKHLVSGSLQLWLLGII